MKTWTQPMAEVQLFVANEYVAACWSVACDVIGQDKLTSNTGVTHAQNACGNPAKYKFKPDANGVPTGLWEHSDSQNMDLECDIFSDSGYSQIINASELPGYVGKTIYWRTKHYNGNGDGRVWSHEGTLSGGNHS